jgi:F-type H+-transporting ATPase subunit delta
MTTDRTGAYAGAIIELARGEDALGTVEDELLQVARHIRGDRDLYRALTEQKLPLARRFELIEEILSAANPVTRTAVVMLTSADRLRDLEAVATAVAERAVGERGRELAEVWVAQRLTDEQKERLREGLERATGKQLEMKVFVDENVIGGVRAKVGDLVIDGSLGKRFDRLRGRVSS